MEIFITMQRDDCSVDYMSIFTIRFRKEDISLKIKPSISAAPFHIAVNNDNPTLDHLYVGTVPIRTRTNLIV